MIITIARKCGCDADTIGRAVAEKYHLHFMDREAIAAGAKEAGCYDEYEEFYSERPVNSLLYSIVMETEEDNVLHDTPGRALTFIDRLPLEDGCEGYVIQGRCANFAFQGRDDVVSVFLTANDAFCVDTVADTHGVSVRKAKTVVRETNDNRKTYHKYYTGQEWGQAENYDLCLNAALGLVPYCFCCVSLPLNLCAAPWRTLCPRCRALICWAAGGTRWLFKLL